MSGDRRRASGSERSVERGLEAPTSFQFPVFSFQEGPEARGKGLRLGNRNYE